jgi:SH3 domain-containing YSC84-like protein 1
LQIGVESVDLVMIIHNQNGMNQLTDSGFQLDADPSAAAGSVGHHATADANWKLDTEIVIYSRAKGAFAGITLNRASVRRDDGSTKAIYEYDVLTRRILRGQVAVPAAANSFLNAVRDAKAQAVLELVDVTTAARALRRPPRLRRHTT